VEEAAPKPARKTEPAASEKPSRPRPAKREEPAAAKKASTQKAAPKPARKTEPAASDKPSSPRPVKREEPAAAKKASTQKAAPKTARKTEPAAGDRPVATKRKAPAAKKQVSSERDAKAKKKLLEEIFALSESALKAGDDTGALECLKRAEVLSPENPEVQERMSGLRKLLKAKIMIKTGYSRLAEENFTEAVKSARKAFDLAPDADGLEEFITEIETCSREASEDESITADYDDAEVWVSRIRSRIQEGAFPLAAELAAKASSIYPDHELIRTFVERFTKMKLLQG
jgi:tetratricopeptide (TPR) repeat protein